MTGHNAETSHPKQGEHIERLLKEDGTYETIDEARVRIDAENAVKLRAEYDARVKKGDLYFAGQLIGSGQIAYIVNQSEMVRKNVAEHLLENLETRSHGMSRDELVDWIISLMADVAKESHTASVMIHRDRAEMHEKRADLAEALAKQAVAERDNLIQEVEAAHFNVRREFMHNEDVTSVLDENFSGIRNRITVPLELPQVPEPQYGLDTQEEEQPHIDIPRAIQNIGVKAVRGMVKVVNGVKTLTGEIKKSA